MNSAIQDIYADPKLIFELAAGVESVEALAARYQLDEAFLREMMENPHIKRQLAERRKELDESGYTLAQKAKLCFEDLLGTVYIKAREREATLPSVLAAAEFFRKVAGLDKRDVVDATPERFSITINIGGQAKSLAPTVEMATEVPFKEFNPNFMGLTVIRDDTLLTLNSQFDYQDAT